MDWTDKHVLVTGAGGFLGRAVVAEARRQGAQVTAVVRPGSVLSNGLAGVTTCACDLETADLSVIDLARSSPTAIIACAGRIGPGRTPAERERLHAANFHIVERLLDVADRAATPPRVVLVSSAAVYGALPPGCTRMSEDTPWRPVDAYGASKAAGALAALARGAAGHLQVTVAIPFNIIGPGQRADLVPQTFIEQLGHAPEGGHATVRVGDVSTVRDWVDVRDVARALVALSAPSAETGVFNICTGTGVSVAAMISKLQALARREVTIMTDPARVRPSLAPRVVGDPARLARAIGWAPQVPLSQSLRDMLAAAFQRGSDAVA